jgi:hypothetical protein
MHMTAREPMELEELQQSTAQRLSTTQTAPAEAPPSWFAGKRAEPAQSSETPSRKRVRKSAGPKIIVESDPGEPLTWRQIAGRWIVSSAALGYLISLVIHSLLLVALSIVIVKGMAGEATVSTLVSQTDEEPTAEFEAVVDTRDDVEGAQAETLELPEMPRVEHSLNVQRPEIKVDLPSDIAAVVGKGQGNKSGDGKGSGGGRFAFRMPEQGKAVTKGSFTAWTVPEDPAPGQNYLIVIQIKLPENVKRYPRKDLSGMVIGTDGYHQKIPPHEHGYLPVEDHETQLVVIVPGAARLVKDTIEIRSKLLDEQQRLAIEF